MKIQVTQTEITAALKQYIVAKGISLEGKQVDITFTAGRKEAGLSAELTIEDADGAVQAEVLPAVVKPALAVVSAPAVEAAPVAETPEPVVAEDFADAQAEAEAATAPVKTTSLFS